MLGVGWHTTHQYSLAKLPFFERYDLVIEPWRRGFATSQRDLPDNIHYVVDVVPDYYDFAILHVDQQSVYRPELGERISKGRLFAELKERIKQIDPNLPIVVINHMTPFHDRLESHEVVSEIKKMTEGCLMVCNSYTAQKQWGWGDVITHGLDAEEWGFDVDHFKNTGRKIPAVKEPRCVTVMSAKGMEKAYRREFLVEVSRKLDEFGVPFCWIGGDRKAFDNFDDYRDYLARSLVFFFPGYQSPRPRSRTEAMLSGCCIVTTPYHDADTFIVSGSLKQTADGEKTTDEKLIYTNETNGFLTSMASEKDPRLMDNPTYAASLIRHLVLDEPEVAREIGLQGQQYARQNFTTEAFESQWEMFLRKHKIWKEL